MEGLTYYLEKDLLSTLFDMFAQVQSKGSVLAFDFWTPESESNPVFLRFVDFCERRFGHRKQSYTLLELSYVGGIPGYELLELTDIQALEKVYSGTRVLSNFDEILPENYAVLRRIS